MTVNHVKTIQDFNQGASLLTLKSSSGFSCKSVDNNAEYLGPVKWHDTKSINSAFSKTGLFGNQNSVCKPTTAKWSHTIERLKTVLK